MAPSVTVAQKNSTSPSSAIDISWTAAGQLSGATYSVVRNGTTTLSCTTSPCADTGLQSGTQYTYTVTAKVGSYWVASGQGSATTGTVAAASALAVFAPATVTAGSSANVTLTAKRANNTTHTSFSGSKPIDWSGAAKDNSPSGAAATLPATATFTNGVATVPATLVAAGTNRTLTAQVEGLTGSTTFTINAAAPSQLALKGLLVGSQSTLCTAADCGPYILGNGGSASTFVELWDSYRTSPRPRQPCRCPSGKPTLVRP